MSTTHSVTEILEAFKTGDPASREQICKKYFGDVALAARKHLLRRGSKRRAADEYDVAVSVFDGLFDAIERGKFPRLDDRKDLWRILLHLTAKRSKNLVRYERAQKRGCGKVRGDSVFAVGDDDTGFGLDKAAHATPTNEEIVDLLDTIVFLFGEEDSEYHEILRLKLAGFTNDEIAEETGLSVATVERRLRDIRHRWLSLESDE